MRRIAVAWDRSDSIRSSRRNGRRASSRSAYRLLLPEPKEARAVDDPAMPYPDQLPSERLKELRSELFEHFGKITRWKVLCQERDATTDEEKILLAEEVS